VGVLQYLGIRGSKLAFDAAVFNLFGVSSPPSPEFVLRHVKKIKFEKFYSEGVRSRPDIRFILFVVTEFGTLGGHATAFLTELAKHEAAPKWVHPGKLLAFGAERSLSRRPCCSRGQRLARFIRRRRQCGGWFFLG
jgi:hypothetical protein